MSAPASKLNSGGGKSKSSSPHPQHSPHGSPKPQILKATTQAATPSKKTENSGVSAAASKGRKKVPGGADPASTQRKADGSTQRKAAGTKNRMPEKRDRKPRKRQPKQNKLLMWLGYGADVVLRDRKAVDVAQALDLRQYHLRVLKGKFDDIDIDGSGSLDASELFESVGETRTPLTDRLFDILDLNPSGGIEFDDYVRIVGTYCMFTKDEILKFCFRCFDHDDSGTIDEKEFCELCKVVNNAAPLFPGNFQRALDEFDVNEDGLIDYSEFVELDRRYPLVLFPAFKLQDMLQKKTLGEHAWVHISEGYHHQKRIEEYKAAHGGKLPPEPFSTRMLKTFFPCFFATKVNIKIGS